MNIDTENILHITKDDLIGIIKDNPDKSCQVIDNKLLQMINKSYGKFTVKQINWLYKKVDYIQRHNKQLYGHIIGFEGFQFIPETHHGRTIPKGFGLKGMGGL